MIQKSYLDAKYTSIKKYRINITKKVQELANEYKKAGILPEPWHDKDRLHIACATIKGCDYLISNNFDDMANSNKMSEINKINFKNGFHEITIISPYTFVTELKQAELSKTTPKPPYTIDATKNRQVYDEIYFKIPLYEQNKRDPQLLGFEIKTGQIIACNDNKKNDRVVYKIKTSTNEEISISNYRLDIYGSFRKPRENEKTQKSMIQKTLSYLSLEEHAQSSEFLLCGKPGIIFSGASAAIPKITSDESEKDTSKIITGSIPKTTFEEKSSELLKTKNKPPRFKPPS